MRTTIDIDDDLLVRLKELAHHGSAPLKKTVNSTLRRALDGPFPCDEAPYRCPVFSMGRPVTAHVDLDKALALAGDIEDAEVVHEIELRK